VVRFSQGRQRNLGEFIVRMRTGERDEEKKPKKHRPEKNSRKPPMYHCMRLKGVEQLC
jgi:hypothetical protein